MLDNGRRGLRVGDGTMEPVDYVDASHRRPRDDAEQERQALDEKLVGAAPVRGVELLSDDSGKRVKLADREAQRIQARCHLGRPDLAHRR